MTKPLLASLVASVAALVVGCPSSDAMATTGLGGTPVALVVTPHGVVAVSMPSGELLRSVSLPEPEMVTATPKGQAVVIGARGTVTLLDWRTLRVLKVIGGFRSPRVAVITPDGQWVYVVDAATGELSVIELETRRIVDRVFVGVGATNLAISPDFERAWVTFGAASRRVVVLDTTKANRPRADGHIRLDSGVRDLGFAPDGRSVWIASATSPAVFVANASSGRTEATIPAGRGPQEIAFGDYSHAPAFVTYDSDAKLEVVNSTTRKVLDRVTLPSRAHDLATGGGLVVTCSLAGIVTEYTAPTLHRWMNAKLASPIRGVAVSVW